MGGKACQQVLDKWEITVSALPNVQKQRDVFFVNEEVGFTVGNAGTILKTTNGGKDWFFLEKYYDLTTNDIVQGALTKATLLTVFFVDEQVGFVGGDGENIPLSGDNIDAVFLKTTDGGDSWSKQYLAGIHEVKDLHFFDKQNGIGMFLTPDENNYTTYKLYSSHDGGSTWEPVLMPNLTVRSSRFDVSDNCLGVWVVEDYFYSKYLRTTDQGLTWQEVQAPGDDCNSLSFRTALEGYANCDGKSFKTNDGGNTWEEYTDSTPEDASLVEFRPTEADGFAFVGVYDYETGGGEVTAILNSFEVHQTTDGGQTWDKTVIDKECDFTGTRFDLSEEVFYTLGWEGVNKFKRK